MPEGMPTPEQLLRGDVRFFSIDTDIIQRAGYNFESGALNQLHNQLPSSMELHLTEVVANEIVKHLMEPVLTSIQHLESAAANLERRASLPMERISELFQDLAPIESSRHHFRKRIEDYAGRCRGGILPMEGEGVLAELFRRYFATEAPFELNAKKKSEFPDAASLLILEAYAGDRDAMAIVVSGDSGWETFAANSDHLYCVKSLEDLTALFTSTGEVAAKINVAIQHAIEDGNSPLRSKLNEALEDHVGNATWDADNVYSDTGSRVEAEIWDAKVLNHDLVIDDKGIWRDEHDPAKWLVEVTATVNVEVSVTVTHYIWDPIDREEIPLTANRSSHELDIEVAAFLSCSNVEADSAPQEWEVEVDIAPGDYSVDLGEVSAYQWEE